MTKERSHYSIAQPLSPEEYEGLIWAVASVSDMFGVVQYCHPRHNSELATRLLNDLVPYLVYLEQDYQWPGTMSSCPNWHLCIHVTDETITMILDVTTSLWDWVNGDFPDDLHFLREDGTTVFGSTWCDEYAWLEVDNEELESITQKLPPSIQVKREEVQEPFLDEESVIAKFRDNAIRDEPNA